MERGRRALAVAGASALLLAGFVAGCGGGDKSSSASGTDKPAATDGGGPAKKVTLLMDWFPNPDHVGLYMAQDKGFFEEAGVDVQLQPPSNPADPVKLVAAGRVPLGISYQSEVAISAAEGLPVTAVAALIPTALNSLMAVEKSGVKGPQDLKGKKVGTAGLPSDTAYLNALLDDAGIPRDSVKEVNVSSNLLAALISGSVDATIGAYRNIEGVELQHRGLNPTILPLPEIGVPNYDELVLIANSDKLASDSDLQDTVKAVVAAIGKGTEAAIADPAGAEQVIAKVAKGYKKDLIKEMIDATVPLLENADGFGHMDPEAWKSYADWMFENKLIKKQVDGSALVTNDYLPQ
jgi:putative hydroxymethylpyrimidine transport system substrate-binding protein